MIYKRFVIGAAVFAMAFCAFAAAAFADTGYVTADVLRVRSEPNTSSEILGTVTNGTQLEILSSVGGWYYVSLPDGSLGYVSADYVDGVTIRYYGYVDATVLKIHSTTGINAPVIGRVVDGTRLELLAYDGAWYKIKTEDGLEGYVSADYIVSVYESVAETQAASASDSSSSTTYGYVIADSLKVHSTTGVYAPVSGNAAYGECVELLAYDGVWFKIRCGSGLEGYVGAQYISFTSGGEPVVEIGYVNATLLNIRETPDTSAEILDRQVMGASLRLMSYEDGWYGIETIDGISGYVSAEYISETPIESKTIAAATDSITKSQTAAPPTSDEIELGEKIIAYAKQYIGTPYVYGASGPDSFDCSGFTMYVMSANGISLPHQSASQAEMGLEVAMDELVAGDLVFFNTTSTEGVGHVGIYIGNGQFIHASSGSAHAVTISSLSEDYYSAHYIGARRVI
ncbi:MAG: SH3 domain-containing protein [Clostridia bacterium]|nr:SH3 domain-containing protein [Clostridia bacterium]